MANETKTLLVKQAMQLTALGVKVEQERNYLRKLVNDGVSYASPSMLAALKRFEEVNRQWKQLEAEHTILRSKLNMKP